MPSAFAATALRLLGKLRDHTESRAVASEHADWDSHDKELHESVDIAHGDARFLKPLRASLELISRLPVHFVLLGSIATAKYVDCLLPAWGKGCSSRQTL